ncbi:hypothetical protein F5X71_29920 [Nocardia brasiliensis]|uniref:Uncharacterized protein n=1 Tax=Nocardia brasiliensis TaxID=37326 RepID=A0A6G9XYF8_NOCBR|nr:hypothetical protein [Nocardia brasiliensis]QIS05968.1 hypothetical protein F5X71_29920 [Nocardia brasiliensis]
MEELGSPVTRVRYPEARRAVINAVAALSDLEYQKRVWLERVYPHENFYDDLDTNVHILYDDYRILPDAESALGDVLVPGDEIERLRTLGRVLDPVIEELGDCPDSRYVAHKQWPVVTRAASAALSAMVLSGGL